MEQPTGAQSEDNTRDIATTQNTTTPNTMNQNTTTQEKSASEAASVASSALDTAKGVTQHAGAQAQDVVHEAREQVASLWGQTRTELDTQLEGRREQTATSLRSLSEELGALAEGRPADASMVMGYLDRGREKVDTFAERMEQRSASELMGDVAGFARRRPGAFLAGAVALGYVAGRAVKVGASSSSNSSISASSSDGANWASTPGGSSFGDTASSGFGTTSTPEMLGGSTGFTSPTPMTDAELIVPPSGDLGGVGGDLGTSDYLADPATEPRP